MGVRACVWVWVRVSQMTESVLQKEGEGVGESGREETGFQIWFVDQKILHRIGDIFFFSLSFLASTVTKVQCQWTSWPALIYSLSHSLTLVQAHPHAHAHAWMWAHTHAHSLSNKSTLSITCCSIIALLHNEQEQRSKNSRKAKTKMKMIESENGTEIDRVKFLLPF